MAEKSELSKNCQNLLNMDSKIPNWLEFKKKIELSKIYKKLLRMTKNVKIDSNNLKFKIV